MKKIVAFWAVLMLCCFSLSAQITTSGLNGQIFASSENSPLAGAVVLLTHTPTSTQNYVVTDGKGYYNLTGLRSGGPYELRVTMLGFADLCYKDIYLPLGENLRVDGVMTVEELDAATVAVEGKKLFLTKTGSSHNLGAAQLGKMPTISKSIVDLVRISPYVNGMGIAGGDGRTTNFTVDGANFNSIFGLYSKLPGGGNPISIEALDEVQIVVSPYDVRQSNFTGGGINTVTKSGSNEYKASAYTYFTNQALRGNRINGIDLGERDAEYDWIFGATASGPIVKNKLFYFIAYEQENKPQQVISYRARLDGEEAGGMVSRTLLSDMQKVADFVRSEYNYDPGSATDFPGDNNNRKVMARLDWNINEQNRLMLRYNYTHDKAWSDPNENSSDTGYRLYNTSRVGPQSMVFANNMYSYNCEVHSATAELNSRILDNLTNQFLATYTHNREFRGSNSTPFPHVDIMYEGKLEPYMSLGYELFSGYTDLTTRVLTVKDDIVWFLEDHRMMAGVSYEYQSASNLYMRNAMMYYRYKSVTDFITKARPESFAITYGYNGIERPADVVDFHQVSLYLQDEWSVSPDFKLTYGIRLDDFIFNPTCYQRNDAIYALTFRDGLKIDTGLAPKPRLSLSPRMGFTYDVLGDASLTLRGGTGLFLGHLPLVYFMNMPSAANLKRNSVQFITNYTSGVETGSDARLDAFASNGMITKVSDAIEHFNLPTVLTPENHICPSSIAGIDPNFKLPQVWKTTLAVDYTLPISFPFTLTAEGVFNKTVTGCYVDNINMQVDDNWPRFAGADNRLIYPTGAGLINSGKKVAYLTNTDQGYGVNAHFSVEMTPVKNLDITASYAFTDSREMTGFPGTELYSSWSSLPSVNGSNRPRLQRTQFVSPHRVTASVNYFVPWRVFNGKGLNVNLFYTAFSPFGYSYVYSNDMNQDGISNDLMYIPADDSEIVFVDNAAGTAEQHRAAFWAFVEQDSYLRSHKGQYASAYEAMAPFVHRFDLQISEDFSFRVGKSEHTFRLSATIMNLTNLLNSKWGINRINTACNSSKILEYEGQDADGRPTFTMYHNAGRFPTASYEYEADSNQCWQIQIGLKYLFN